MNMGDRRKYEERKRNKGKKNSDDDLLIRDAV